MVQQERMTKASKVISTLYRSKAWRSTWTSIRQNKRKTRTANPTVTSERRLRSSRHAGRPHKVKRRGGRPPSKVLSKRGRPRKNSVAAIEKSKIESFGFVSPPAFVPKPAGRTPKVTAGTMMLVHGVRHTLTHSRNILCVNSNGSSQRLWKQDDGRCVCCYSSTDPLTRRNKAKRTVYACDKCRVYLCRYCFHNVWSKHIKKCISQVGIVHV